MDRFEHLTAVAAPLLRDNIDTDVIIRIERLIGTSRRLDLAPWCFEALRYRPDGSDDPDFVLNQPAYRGAAILLAGANFGCGSSREGAVWALQQMGVRCVIAPSFGDIFFGNCFQNGLLPIVLGGGLVEELAAEVAEDPGARRLQVDLEATRVISPGGREIGFAIAPLRRMSLLKGLDEVELTLERGPEIDAFQAADRLSRPWIYDTVAAR